MNYITKYCIILIGIWLSLTWFIVIVNSYPSGLVTFNLFNEMIIEFIILSILLIFYIVIFIIEIIKDMKK